MKYKIHLQLYKVSIFEIEKMFVFIDLDHM